MAITLISMLALANVALTAPVAQRDVACQATYISVAGDTCKSIGLDWGYYNTDILVANPFLNCDDIWVGTNICIPDIPRPATVTYPVISATTVSGAPGPLPTPVCSQTYTSVAGDNCDNIGAKFGLTGADVYNANTFLNCNDIWQNTPICLPNISATPTITVVPVPSCITTYTSVAGDTCDSIAAQYGITGTQIHNANTFLDCSDIWNFTPICVPAIVIVDPSPTDEPVTSTIAVVPVPSCIATYTSVSGDTCDSIAAQYGITGTQIHNANTFLDCSDIWNFTPICVPAIVIVDPFPTDEPLTFNPTDPITVDPPTDPVTSDPPTDPVTSDPPTEPATTPAATPTTTVE